MVIMTRFSAKIALMLLFFVMSSPAARAGDDMQIVAALWSDFVQALRRGDYVHAHALFSPESRNALPYQDFVREYGPLSSARELVLARPETFSTRLDGDWAEVVYAGINPGSGRNFRIGVAAVRNQQAWRLVAARNEAPERIEAAARGVLRRIAEWRGNPEAARLAREFLASLAETPVAENYRFAAAGTFFSALPARQGLRAFHVDAWGTVREGTPGAGGTVRELPAMPPAVAAPAKAPAAAPVPAALPLVDGLPEMREPPATAASMMPGELPEPPPPAPVRVAEPERVELPDTIR